jgi:hypothetical protein
VAVVVVVVVVIVIITIVVVAVVVVVVVVVVVYIYSKKISLPFDYCVKLQKYILTHILRFFQEHARGKSEKLELLLDEIVALAMSMFFLSFLLLFFFFFYFSPNDLALLFLY